MFILKIHRDVREVPAEGLPNQFDQSDRFIEADEVTAWDWVEPDKQAKVVEDYADQLDGCADYSFHNGENTGWSRNEPARLIHVKRGDVEHWYLASHAWLMTDGGRTVERLA